MMVRRAKYPLSQAFLVIKYREPRQVRPAGDWTSKCNTCPAYFNRCAGQEVLWWKVCDGTQWQWMCPDCAARAGLGV